MPLRPEQARALLPHVDPARLQGGWPIGLRDGALLALTAAGLSSFEIAALQANAVTMVGGQLHVTTNRHGVPWFAVLPTDLGAHLLVWLSECRLWAEARPVLRGPRGPLTAAAVRQILARYRHRTGTRPHRRKK